MISDHRTPAREFRGPFPAWQPPKRYPFFGSVALACIAAPWLLMGLVWLAIVWGLHHHG